MDKYEDIQSIDQQRSSMRFFTFWVLIAQVLGLTSVVLVAVWMGHFGEGFAWQENPAKEFNYHPLFMIIGLVFLQGDSIIVYRVFRNDKKIYIKVLHACLHIFAIIFAAVGLKAVFDSHNLKDPPGANLYSLHSWLGLTTVILFGMQWLCGFVTFLFPGLQQSIRSMYMRYHVFWGFAIFLMSVATALIGMNEREAYHNTDYEKKNSEGILVNCLGLVLVALALTISYIVSHPDYKRQPTLDEEQLQLTQ